MGIFFGGFIEEIFKIGQKYINITAQRFECFGIFIAAGIIDNGYRKIILFGNIKCLNYLGDVMGRRNEFKTVSTALLLFEKNLCKSLY